MKKDQIKIGHLYTAKVSGRIVNVRIDSANSRGGWNATNTATGKHIRIKTAQRLWGEAVNGHQAAKKIDGTPTNDAANEAAHDADVCATVGCGRPSDLIYLGRPRCQACYEDDVADDATPGRQAGETGAPPNHEEQSMATKPKTKRRPAADAKPKRISALDAAAQVLADSDKPLRAKDMIEAMATRGLWSSPNGKTPEATLYAAILREISTKGDAARFRKVERGQFVRAGAAR
ncbi:MAG: winged helix-turn-helix domain-containing protein [Phycisphaerales bacterium]|nr:winged helix-turn-helix domain-containing protein [Phycisphaerales bacterium]